MMTNRDAIGNLIAASAVSLAGIFAGHAAMADEGIDMSGYPTCRDDRGSVARYLDADSPAAEGLFVMYANARYLDDENQREPAIIIDPDFVRGASPVFVDFMVSHECYHLQSGDARYAMALKRELDEQHKRFPRTVQQQVEGDANCAAAYALKEEYGYRSADLDRLESELADRVSTSHAREVMPLVRGCFSGTISYPQPEHSAP